MLNSKRKIQILIGVALLVICAIILLIAATGNTLESTDATAVIFIAPVALGLIFIKGEYIF